MKKQLSKLLQMFARNYLVVVWGGMLLREHKSPEAHADSIARAALKRERKAKKRVADNFHCIRHNYIGHATNYLV